MQRSNASMLALSLAGLLAALGVACEHSRDRERRESTPGETRTRSGELERETPRVEAPRVDIPAEPRPSEPAPARTEPTQGQPLRDAATTDPRYDSGRLSIVGSAEDRERNLGMIAADAAAAPPPGPPQAPFAPALAPPPQQGAGYVEPLPVPTVRQGAGRPGAGGDPYQ